MQRKQGGLVPVADALADLNGPVTAPRDASPQARHHFTRFDQIHQLVSASEADSNLGFMVRTMALCSLPRTNPGNSHQYKRVNGPYKLVMVAGADNKLPYGTIPRLLLAWVSTEAVRTQSRELVLGRSLSKFMRTLGIGSDSGGIRGELTRFRNQMKRLFGCTVSLIYEDAHGEQFVSTLIAERGEFWWNERKPEQSSLWNSKIYLGEALFTRDHPQSGAAGHEHPHGAQTLRPGPRSLPLADLPDLCASFSAEDHQEAVVPSVRFAPLQSQRQANRPKFPVQDPARVEEDQSGLAGPELRHGQRGLDPLPFDARYPSGAAALARGIAIPCPSAARQRSFRVGLDSGGIPPLLNRQNP